MSDKFLSTGDIACIHGRQKIRDGKWAKSLSQLQDISEYG